MKRLLFCFLLVFICLFSFGQSKTKGQQLLDKATRDWKSFFVDITSVNYSDIDDAELCRILTRESQK